MTAIADRLTRVRICSYDELTPELGAEREELPNGGGLAMHGCQHQRCSARAVARIHRRALAHQVVHLGGVARAGCVVQTARQRCAGCHVGGGRRRRCTGGFGQGSVRSRCRRFLGQRGPPLGRALFTG